MLTKLTIRNFKLFEEVEIELGNPVVFIGPNNSGKSTALQGLALWEVGLRRWLEKRGGKETAAKRPGVAINRRDLNAIPVPAASLLWRSLHLRDVRRTADGKPDTRNIRIDVVVEGVTGENAWKCGLEFDYANDESLYCRPLRLSDDRQPTRMEIPPEVHDFRVAFLPPMSGLSEQEFFKQRGEIDSLIGQGRTAEVLRNLCWQIIGPGNDLERWNALRDQIMGLFGLELERPDYITERSEVTLGYRDRNGVRLDISSAGRGLHQTLLLLAFLTVNPGSVLLLDEPDAHLEILRQRQIYQVLTETARRHGSQIVAASHSEVVLNEAAQRDVVVAFVGRPHRIDDRGSQVLKALRDIGFEEYYQAQHKGWVLYLEGSTDLAILQAFAGRLDHPVRGKLERPFVRYVQNQPQRARHHFYGLREAKTDLAGFLVCDRLDQPLDKSGDLNQWMWSRREIENYLCQPDTLVAFAGQSATEVSPGPLFDAEVAARRRDAMRESIEDLVPPLALRDPTDRWWRDTKSSDELLDRLFEMFYRRLGLPNAMQKSNYHLLVEFVPIESIEPEITEVLDAILECAEHATPLAD